MRLQVRNGFPEAVAALPATALADALAGPTLFDIRQGETPPLFISVLVHGDETSGWEAVCRLRAELLNASALLFVGNVAAAKAGVRVQPGRPDFNRVWQGGDSPEAAVADEVAQWVGSAAPRLAVDVHSTTGRNPAYSVLAAADAPTLAVAGAFSGQALLATQPHGFQTGRLAQFCTALTVEVGMRGDPAGTEVAVSFLRRLLRGTAPPSAARPLALFETVARILPQEDAVLAPETQRFNFRTAPAGALIARRGTVLAQGADDRDLGDVYLDRLRGATLLKRPTVIASYTGDPRAARQDCLCYFLEPASADASGGAPCGHS